MQPNAEDYLLSWQAFVFANYNKGLWIPFVNSENKWSNKCMKDVIWKITSEFYSLNLRSKEIMF